MPASYKQVRYYKCILCSEYIIESRMCHTIDPDEVPDISTCDFNKYDQYQRNGGVILKSGRSYHWVSSSFAPKHVESMDYVTTSGICDECLENETVKKLMPYLTLVDLPLDRVLT